IGLPVNRSSQEGRNLKQQVQEGQIYPGDERANKVAYQLFAVAVRDFFAAPPSRELNAVTAFGNHTKSVLASNKFYEPTYCGLVLQAPRGLIPLLSPGKQAAAAKWRSQFEFA